MPNSEAVVKSIPLCTKAEEAEKDAHEVRDIFSGEDIGQLDLNFRRSRRLRAESVEEYLACLEFNPTEDEDDMEGSLENQKGLFKKNYKMKILDVEEKPCPVDTSGKKDERNNSLKNFQISSASTKSEFKKSQTSENKLFMREIKSSGEPHILEILVSLNIPAYKLGKICADGSFTLSANCEAKMFKTPDSIAWIGPFPQSGYPQNAHPSCSKEPVFPSGGFNADLDRFLGCSVDSLIPKKALDFSPSSGHKVTKTDSKVYFSIIVEEPAGLILLEFSKDEDLLTHLTLAGVHVYQPTGESISDKLLLSLNSPSKQEGCTSVLKFMGSLLKFENPSSPQMNSEEGLDSRPAQHGSGKMQMMDLKPNKRSLSSVIIGGYSPLDLSPQIQEEDSDKEPDDAYCGFPRTLMDVSFSL